MAVVHRGSAPPLGSEGGNRYSEQRQAAKRTNRVSRAARIVACRLWRCAGLIRSQGVTRVGSRLSAALPRDALDAAIADPGFAMMIEQIVGCVAGALAEGRKVLLAGNGGSAADAQHIAGEFLSRLNLDRNPLPAIALTTDSSVLTAIGNDYGYRARVRAPGARHRPSRRRVDRDLHLGPLPQHRACARGGAAERGGRDRVDRKRRRRDGDGVRSVPVRAVGRDADRSSRSISSPRTSSAGWSRSGSFRAPRPPRMTRCPA